MKTVFRSRTARTLIWTLAAACTAGAASAQAAQDDPFDALKRYDFQSRQSVESIRLMIDKSLGDAVATGQIEQKLDTVLSDPAASFAGKQEAARFLWIIGSGRSVPVLGRLLTDEKLSNVARYALERNSDPSAGKALVAALSTAQGPALIGIINSIGDRGDADAVPALKKYLSSTDPLVQDAAVVALGKVGTMAAVAALRNMPPADVTAGIALRRAADKLAASGRRSDAVQVYGLVWSAARPANVRGEAVRGLAAVGAPNAGRVALAALRSDDPYLQVVGAQVIASTPDPAAVASALADWQSLAVAPQVALLTVLGERRDAAIAPTVTAALASKDSSVRLAAIRAAGRLGGAQMAARLIDVLVHGEGGDREAAREALAGMPGADSERVILEQVRAAGPDVRSALVPVILERPTPAAIGSLMELARGSDARAATTAVRAIGRVGSAREQADLIRLLVSTNSDGVRDAAKEAVVAIGQRMESRQAATGPVLAAYGTATGPAKAVLLAVMAETGGDAALEELQRSAVSPDTALKQAAIQGLAETWPDSRALPTLLEVARTDQNRGIRVQALRGYLRLVGQDESMSPEDRVSRIASAVKLAERPEEKRQALSVLRNVRVQAAMDLAAQMLSDPGLFPDAADTVIDLAGKQRRNNRDLAAVTGPTTTAALDRVIQMTKDDNQKAAAQKLRQ